MKIKLNDNLTDDELKDFLSNNNDRYVYKVENKGIISADSQDELLELFLKGIDIKNENKYLSQKIALCKEWQKNLQKRYVDMYVKIQGGLPKNALSNENVLNALTNYDFIYEGDEWTEDIPLFIVATDYEPITDIKIPVGNNVFMLKPNDTTQMLNFWEMLGVAQLFEKTESD